jgi:hypothetical protein
MPADPRLRLDKNQCLPLSRPKPPQHNPEEPIRRPESRLWMPHLQHNELLPQSQLFKQQAATGEHGADEQSEKQSQQSVHAVVVARSRMCKIESEPASQTGLKISGGLSPKPQISMPGYNFGEGQVLLIAHIHDHIRSSPPLLVRFGIRL